MKIQYFGIIFFFFNRSLFSQTKQVGLVQEFLTGDTLILGGISISLLFLFGLVLKESVDKPERKRKTNLQESAETKIEPLSSPQPEAQPENSVLSKQRTDRFVKPNEGSFRQNKSQIVWKREVPSNPELIEAHRKFLEQLGARIQNAEIYFLSGEVSFLLASKRGKIFHLPESPEELNLSEKILKEIREGRIGFQDDEAYIPLATGILPFGFLKLALTDWKLLNPREFQSWKEEYEERVSIQFESSDPETGFGNIHAFELDKTRVHENILIFASVETVSSLPYVLKWISLWTSKIIRKQIRFYRIRQDRVAFFLSEQDWEIFSKNLNELVESLQKDNHPVDLNLGVSILEENKEEWSTNARKALGLSIEQGPNRYICL
ncbi:hypothetical protein [Leptospira adleri]|uniref:GGDEF domain-containing protein n=1 Tax=Leptospira adleri TaxID=2023186 RepID=A0A2M9YT27_9LEPT|nr:hypothetical protein [Leptospira adleri]PJZ54679.1 hypothetical protein CH380_02880 [Leptospira adleri]PJZ60828.1 hypothetical protein CH376_16400 [Leptospira adleri]